ncbi:hypothetical protein [Microcoleus sp. T2B6]
MPVPQKVNFLVEQASCLFIKSLLRMVNISVFGSCKIEPPAHIAILNDS